MHESRPLLATPSFKQNTLDSNQSSTPYSPVLRGHVCYQSKVYKIILSHEFGRTLLTSRFVLICASLNMAGSIYATAADKLESNLTRLGVTLNVKPTAKRTPELEVLLKKVRTEIRKAFSRYFMNL